MATLEWSRIASSGTLSGVEIHRAEIAAGWLVVIVTHDATTGAPVVGSLTTVPYAVNGRLSNCDWPCEPGEALVAAAAPVAPVRRAWLGRLALRFLGGLLAMLREARRLSP
jgi:hypothetical protein